MPADLIDRCTRAAAAVITAAALILATPGAAAAHGVGGGAESILDFIWLGVNHMVVGWDHLAFIVGVVLLAGAIRRAATFVSLFALGHSTTLIAATLAAWRVNPTAVDIVIASSVVFVGVVAVFGRPTTPARWRLFGAAVFGFGLVHGLGLSTRLQDIHVDALSRIIAFNIGIELGQLLIITAVGVCAAAFLPDRVKTSEKARRLAGIAVIAVGFLAGAVLTVTEFTRDDPATATATGACRPFERTTKLPFGSGHPGKDFYEPGETAPLGDFGHVIGDGYLIVQYRPTLPTDQLDELRTFVTGPEGGRVVAGAATDQADPLVAFHMHESITCASFDLSALKEFKERWFADPRSRVE